MEITKKEIEKILGYEITDYKIIKKAYRGKKVSSMTIAVKPKSYSPGDIIVTIKSTK